MKNIKIVFVYCFLTLILLITNFTQIAAQETNGYTLSPTTNTVYIEAETSKTYSFSITNNENVETSMMFGIYETNDKAVILQDEASQISSKWIKLINPSSIILKPFETKEIQYQINIPQNAPQTLLKSTILIEVSTEFAEASYQFQMNIPYIINFIPTRILDSEAGNKINISKVQDSLSLLNRNSVQFSIQNKTSQNSYSKPIVYIQVLNTNNVTIYSKILNEGAKELINSNELSYNENFEIPIDILNDFGTYTIEVMAVDVLSEATVVSKTSFINIPYYYLIFLVVLIFSVIKALQFRQKKP